MIDVVNTSSKYSELLSWDVRTSLLQYSSGGSIYSFGEAFPSLLVAQPAYKTAARTFTTHSLQDSLHAPSSSSFLSNQELLQEEVPVDNLILPAPFEELDRRSLLPLAVSSSKCNG